LGVEGAWPTSPLRILEERLHADPSRVVLRPFHLGWQAKNAPGGRALRLVQDVAALSEEQVVAEYTRVLHDFEGRHWQTEKMFDERFREVRDTVGCDCSSFSETRRRLLGAFFCHEYTYAAAALMNPSIVPHPDQSGMQGGAVRFVMSLRAVGEGHISSVAFREGIAEPDGGFSLWPQSHFATAVELDDASLADSDAGVTVHRHPESSRTRDFRRFVLQPIEGRAGRNKGMALFPQKIDGQYCMVGRQDGKNLFLLRSDRLDRWDDEGVMLMEPKFPWEFVQIGNCGSPILTRLAAVHPRGRGDAQVFARLCAAGSRQSVQGNRPDARTGADGHRCRPQRLCPQRHLYLRRIEGGRKSAGALWHFRQRGRLRDGGHRRPAATDALKDPCPPCC